MEQFAEFQGPSANDYVNVRALNTAFLKTTSTLSGTQQERLAAAPLLLFSVHECDLQWWDRLLGGGGQVDLMDDPDVAEPLRRQLQFAALSFLWHLSRRNPYAARVITGASVAWCERIAALPLVTLLHRAGARADLIRSRLEVPGTLGDHLLLGARSSRNRIRRSSQHTALQVLLTHKDAAQPAAMASAACDMVGPVRALNKKV